MPLSVAQHVFISYGRSDGRATAQELNRFLRARGISTWQDVRDIDPYMDFSGEIERAIESAMHVVVCLTPSIATKKDSFVRREVIYAQGIGVPITPLVMPGFPVGRIPVLLNHYTWIDAGGTQWESACLALLQRIRAGTSDARALPWVDPFRDILHALYKDITSYLEQTVITLLPTHSQSLDDAVLASRRPSMDLRTGIFRAALPVRPPIGKQDTALVRYNNIGEAFRAAADQLLVLGEPGSGKTTALMAFAREVVAARLEDTAEPLPLIGRLADWCRAGAPSLPEWLATSMRVDADKLLEVMSRGGALLLLDGFDEVLLAEAEQMANGAGLRPTPLTPSYRAKFAEEFDRSLGRNRAIVTCRAKDYQSDGPRLSLKHAVMIRPLDPEQVLEYLEEDETLSAAVRADPELAEVVRTPLLLSLFAVAYQGQKGHGRSLRELRSAPGGLRDQVIGSYVERRFEHEALRANWNAPFSLVETYDVLGRAAIENQDFEITNRETVFHPGKPLQNAISEALGARSAEFIEQALQLHLLIRDEQRVLRFVHPLVRDHFAVPSAIAELERGPENSPDRFKIVTLLARTGDCRAVDALLTKALTPEGRIRPQYHFHLDAFGDPRIVRAYARTLSSTSSYYIYDWVSPDAASSIGKLCNTMGHSVVARILVDALAGASGRDRADYALALGLTKSSLGVQALVDALADGDPEVRACSAHALGMIGDKAAVAPLSRIVGDTAMENRPDHTYPWPGGDYWDPRESSWEPVVHRSVGEIAAEAITKVIRQSFESIGSPGPKADDG